MTRPKCERCGAPMRHIATIPPVSKAQGSPVSVYQCDACGHVAWQDRNQHQE